MEPLHAGLDHLRLAVPDLAAANEALERLGFAVHGAEAPAWRAVTFPFDHLELEHGTGPALLGIGLAGDGAAEDAEPQTRRIDGPLDLAFAEATVAADGLPFRLSRSLTPEALRPPAALRHPNGAAGLRTATFVVADPDAAAQALAHLFGEGALTRTDAVVALRLDRATLLFATVNDAELLHPDLVCDLDDPVEAPRLVSLGLTVADIEGAAAALAAGGHDPQRRADSSLGVTAPALELSFEFHPPS